MPPMKRASREDVRQAIDEIRCSEAQRALVRQLRWTNCHTLPEDPDDLQFGTDAPAEHGVHLYAARTWPADSHYSATFVWDSRASGGMVPAYLDGPIDPDAPNDPPQKIWLRGGSSPAPGWPVERGDRIFAELTEVRAMQASRLELEAALLRQPELAQRIALAGGEAKAIENGARAALRERWPDVVFVTSAVLDGIAEARLHQPGPAVAGDSPAAVADDSYADLFDDVAREVIDAYGEALTPWLLAEAARDPVFRRVVLDAVENQQLPPLDKIRHFHRRLSSGKVVELPATAWAGMRASEEHRFIEGCSLRNPNSRLRVDCILEFVGLEFDLYGRQYDIGYCLLVAIGVGDAEMSRLAALEYFPRTGLERARSRFARTSSEPSTVANEAAGLFAALVATLERPA